MQMHSFFNRHWFSMEASQIWSDEAVLQTWLEVEAALAEAQADLGLVPVTSARRIRACARAELYDLAALADDIAFAQHPFVPVLKAFCAQCGEGAARHVHWGATTQNIFDTAHALQMRQTSALMQRDLDQISDQLRDLALAHMSTVQAGRTHGQHALPITFGYKVAVWKDELDRQRARLADLSRTAYVARFGGAVGTYAALKGRGQEVERRLAERLDLAAPTIGGRSDYDRQAELLSLWIMIAASLERVARDILFLQRTEIGELAETHYEGRYGSSTMAQKRNPTGAQKVIGLCRLARSRANLIMEAMVREDEGDAVATNVTDYSVPELGVLVASASAGMVALVVGLQVDSQAMARNAALSGGLINAEAIMMRLADRIGRDHAHEAVYKAARLANESGVSFLQALATDLEIAPLITELDLASLVDPAAYVGDSESIVLRLAPARELPQKRKSA